MGPMFGSAHVHFHLYIYLMERENPLQPEIIQQ